MFLPSLPLSYVSSHLLQAVKHCVDPSCLPLPKLFFSFFLLNISFHFFGFFYAFFLFSFCFVFFQLFISFSFLFVIFPYFSLIRFLFQLSSRSGKIKLYGTHTCSLKRWTQRRWQTEICPHQVISNTKLIVYLVQNIKIWRSNGPVSYPNQT